MKSHLNLPLGRKRECRISLLGIAVAKVERRIIIIDVTGK